MWHLLINPGSFKFLIWSNIDLNLCIGQTQTQSCSQDRPKKNKKSDPTSPSRLNTSQPCIIVTSDHFWHHAINLFSLYLLFKNFTCTCLHCLLLTMRLWLSLFAGTDSQLQAGALDSWPSLNFLVLYFEGGFIIYIPQKYKVFPYIYIYIYIHTH